MEVKLQENGSGVELFTRQGRIPGWEAKKAYKRPVKGLGGSPRREKGSAVTYHKIRKGPLTDQEPTTLGKYPAGTLTSIGTRWGGGGAIKKSRASEKTGR